MTPRAVKKPKRRRSKRTTDTARIDWMQRHGGTVDLSLNCSPGKQWWGGADTGHVVQGRSMRDVIDQLMRGARGRKANYAR